MALLFTQSPTEMSTRNIPWRVKRGERVRKTIASCESILDVLQPYGPPQLVTGTALLYL
jgi:hypothetical protein